MKSKASSETIKTIALVSMLAVTGIYVYVQYYFVPTSQKLSNLQAQLRQSRDKLKSLEAITANEALLQAQYKQVEQAVALLRKSLPGESELPAVMEVLSNLASKSNVKIQTIFPERSSIAVNKALSLDPSVYKEVPIQIDAIAGFHQLATFLNQVETGDKPMQMVSMRISSNPKDPRKHQINLLLKAYFSIAAEQIPGA